MVVEAPPVTREVTRTNGKRHAKNIRTSVGPVKDKEFNERKEVQSMQIRE